MMVDKVKKNFSVALHFDFRSMEGPQYGKERKSTDKQ